MQIRAETEKEIQTICGNYLKMMGWYIMRLNSGRIPMDGKQGRRLIMLADPGTPDMMAFKQRPTGLCIAFFEYKRPKMKPTWLQEQKMAELTQHGAYCFVTHSLEELQAQLQTIDKQQEKHI